MSVGPTGITGSFAGSPLAQGKGADVERTQQETSDQARGAQADRRAEQAGGIGETEQDQEAHDRDADGRRPWEIGGRRGGDAGESEDGGAAEQRLSRDPTGQRGTQLDLSG